MRANEQVESLVGRWEDARDRGDWVQLEELCRNCPELLPILRRKISAIQGTDASRGPPTTLSFVVKEDDDFVAITRDRQRLDLLLTGFSPGALIAGRYRIIREIGRGGMGVVSLARDERLNRSVAIKAILTRHGPADLRHREHMEELFLKEARIGASLVHPGIATVFDYGIHQGNPYTVLEYLAGESLRAVFERRRRLPLEESRDILRVVAQTLDYAHAEQILHRDLKPENIRFSKLGEPKVLDLGVARHITLEEEWDFSGTPAYASPEQAAESACDGRSDQYSLGVIAYEMLTGCRPFTGRTPAIVLRKHQREYPTPPHSIVPDIGTSVSRAIMRALAKEPERRYSSCQEFAAALGVAQYVIAGEAARFRGETEVRAKSSGEKLMWRRTRRTWLALADNGLWSESDGYVDHVPTHAIEALRQTGKCLSFTRSHFSQREQIEFTFASEGECDWWFEHLSADSRDDTLPRDARSLAWRKHILLLRNRPAGRFQQLGFVDATATTMQQSMSALRIRVASRNASAAIDVASEKLPDESATLHRSSGVAVTAIDAPGEDALLRRWFTDAIRQQCSSLRYVAAFGWAMFAAYFSLMTHAFGTSHILTRASDTPQLAMPAAILAMARTSFPFVLAATAWPIAALTLLKKRQWPRLVPPVCLSVAALAIPPAAWALGVLSCLLFSATAREAAAYVGSSLMSPFVWYAVGVGTLGILSLRMARIYRRYQSARRDQHLQIQSTKSRLVQIIWIVAVFCCFSVGAVSFALACCYTTLALRR